MFYYFSIFYFFYADFDQILCIPILYEMFPLFKKIAPYAQHRGAYDTAYDCKLQSFELPLRPSFSRLFHNATSHAEGRDLSLCFFSAYSALKGFSLQSEREILSPTMELLDDSESGFFCVCVCVCCPTELQDHGKALF